MLARFLPPIKISVEVPLCVIEHQTFPARIALVFRKGCREVSQSVAPQRVRPQVEPYRQQCRTTSAKSPWRAYLDLDFRVTEKRRSNKVLDTLEKEYRRTSTAHWGQHKAQRGVGVFVVVDIENFLRSSKTLDQSRKLTPAAQTVEGSRRLSRPCRLPVSSPLRSRALASSPWPQDFTSCRAGARPAIPLPDVVAV